MPRPGHSELISNRVWGSQNWRGLERVLESKKMEGLKKKTGEESEE